MNFEKMENQQEAGKELARSLFGSWNEALRTRDPKKVAGLYMEQVTFLPTVSPEFKKTNEETEDYFVHFLEKSPEGGIVADEAELMGDNHLLHTGLYDFKVSDNGNQGTVKARFTFIWKKDGSGKWRISHHHSSKVPEGKNAAEEDLDKAA